MLAVDELARWVLDDARVVMKVIEVGVGNS
jgi:hypothetical protein